MHHVVLAAIACETRSEPIVPGREPERMGIFAPVALDAQERCPPLQGLPGDLCPLAVRGPKLSSIMSPRREHSFRKTLQGPMNEREDLGQRTPALASAFAEQGFSQHGDEVTGPRDEVDEPEADGCINLAV